MVPFSRISWDAYNEGEIFIAFQPGKYKKDNGCLPRADSSYADRSLQSIAGE